MKDLREVIQKRGEIEDMWRTVINNLTILGDEEFDVKKWKNAIKCTYDFLYDIFKDEMIDKENLGILFMMHELTKFPVNISDEFNAAQMVTETLLDNIMGYGIECIDDEKLKKGELVVEGNSEEMLLYRINIDDIDLYEIIEGELL